MQFNKKRIPPCLKGTNVDVNLISQLQNAHKNCSGALSGLRFSDSMPSSSSAMGCVLLCVLVLSQRFSSKPVLIEAVGGLEWAALRKRKLRFKRPDVLLSENRSSVDGEGILRSSLLEDTTAVCW